MGDFLVRVISPVHKLHNLLEAYGIDGQKFVTSARNTPRFLRTLQDYRRKSQGDGAFPVEARRVKPILHEFTDQAGAASGHYFYQDLWAARRIYAVHPMTHLDIGSRIDGFVTHLLTFMPVTVIDIRPLTSTVDGLTFMQADATDLAGIQDDSVASLSSLHAVEHFGLGRYGDPVEPDACFRAMRALARVLQPGGRLYFSVPIGIERVEFNAHRVFAPDTILRTMGALRLVSFAAIDDRDQFWPDARPTAFAHEQFACGLFEFMK
jgi:SAM-dependent methyltransferase